MILSEDRMEEIKEYLEEGLDFTQISKKMKILDIIVKAAIREIRNEVNKKAPRATYARYSISIKPLVLEQIKTLVGTQHNAAAIKRVVEMYFKGETLKPHTLITQKETINVIIKSNSYLVKQLMAFIEDVPCGFTMPDAIRHIIAIQYSRSVVKEV